MPPLDSVRQQLTGGKRDVTGLVFRLLLLASPRRCPSPCWPRCSSTWEVRASACSRDRGEAFLSGGLRTSAAAAGVFQAIRGTFWIGVFVVVFSLPASASASALYLEEYATKGRFARLPRRQHPQPRRRAVDRLRHPRPHHLRPDASRASPAAARCMAAGITLAILVLPIVIITSAEAVRAVPAGAARRRPTASAPRGGRSPARQVLPYALPGIITGTVLALARAIGEAAPLLLVRCRHRPAPGQGGPPRRRRRSTIASPHCRSSSPTGPEPPARGSTRSPPQPIIVMLVIVLAMNTVAILLRSRYEKKRK